MNQMENHQEENRPRFFYLVPAANLRRATHETLWQYVKKCLFWGNKQSPAGGVKVIYQHCDLLNKNGYKAYPVHLDNFRIKWFPYQSTPISEKDARHMIKESDVLVCPEFLPLGAAPFLCKNKIAFVQGWSLVQKATGPDKGYEDFGFTRLLVCSHYTQNYMESRSKLPCSLVVNGIDLGIFTYFPERKKHLKVLYLNRRNAPDARQAVRDLGPEIRKAACFVELECRYNQNQMARHYQEADIFVALGYPEGFSLPPLEAMACGCAVVGFTGGGGTEHMIDEKTALVAPDGDIEKLSRCLSKIIVDEKLRENIRMGGLSKSNEFSIRRMEKDLLTFASSFHPAS